MNQQEQIQKDGANARALGRDLVSNPYYVASGMPSATGERLEEWHAKAVAWEAGWRAEDLIRGGAGVPAAQKPQPGMTATEVRDEERLAQARQRISLDGQACEEIGSGDGPLTEADLEELENRARSLLSAIAAYRRNAIG
jgi:hypothetical protein